MSFTPITTATTYPKIFFYGTQAEYDGLASKSSTALYFTSDTHKIYKGGLDYSEAIIVQAERPITGIVAGKLYYFTNTHTLETYNSSEWKVLSYPVATSISVSSTNSEVASAKAVYDYVDSQISSLAASSAVVSSIASKMTTAAGENNTTVSVPVDATITYTMADNATTHDVVVKGVVTTPTWNGVSRVLTLPVAGGETVTVNIGKDIFIDSTAQNGYNASTGNIELYLNDGDGSHEPTKIEVPASSLVDTYVADNSAANGVNIAISGTSVSASVILAEDVTSGEGQYTNLLTTVGSAGSACALVVKSSDVAAVLNSRLSGIEGDIADHASSIAANATSIGNLATSVSTLNGDSATSGSVAYQIAETGWASRISDLETSVTNLAGTVDNLAAATNVWNAIA